MTPQILLNLLRHGIIKASRKEAGLSGGAAAVVWQLRCVPTLPFVCGCR